MKFWIAFLSMALLLVACDESSTPAGSRPAPTAMARTADPSVVARGAQVFRQNCAACHGDRAQGAFRWEHPGSDGRYPPPPLDGSAHAWHHPQAALEQTIRAGTQAQGGSMPAWGDKLSDADIRAVIAWFQSLWPDPIYAAWADTDRRARSGRP